MSAQEMGRRMMAEQEQGSGASAGTTTGAAAQVVTRIAPAGEATVDSNAGAAGEPRKKMTLAEVRAKLDGTSGRRFWRNLDQLAEEPEFHELLQEEFPRQASEWTDAMSRRGFMKVMGASMALAGLAGCTKQPDEPIFPYIRQPEDLVLGVPMYFATAHPFPTGAIPVLVKSDSFRPIKVDGNPEHPMSRGKSDAITQGTLLGLYDPDRSQHVLNRGQSAAWSQFQIGFAGAVRALPGGKGLWFLSDTVTSPTLAAQWKQVQAAYPQAQFVQWEPVNRDSARTAAKAAFGHYVDAQYKLENADLILSLDADFLSGVAHPGFLPMSRAYAERHRYEEGKTMNRMYVVETMPTVTGFKAEHRLAVRPSQVAAIGQALVSGTMPAGLSPDQVKFLTTLAGDLKSAGSRAVVIPGEQASPAVHAAALALNAQLGAVGNTVVYTETVNPMPSEQMNDLRTLVAAMNAGEVQWLVVLGANPVYAAPADANFLDAFNRVPNTVHLGQHVDETGSIATWHINQAHYLESWSDARAYDGTLSIIQPMIAPIYNGRSAHEVLQALLPNPELSPMEVVQANVQQYLKGNAGGWRKSLHDGWVEGTAFTPRAGFSAPGGGASALPPEPAASTEAADTFEIGFRHDPSLYDGRFANIGWLQELPKQISNLSWDNAAQMSLDTMERHKLEENNIIEISVGGRTVLAPVLLAYGHADGAITLHLGLGRQASAGRVAAGVGFSAYPLRTSAAPLHVAGATIKKHDGTWDLCVTKVHDIEHRGRFAQHQLQKPLFDVNGTFSLAGHEAQERGIIRYTTLDEAKKEPNFAHEGDDHTLVRKVGYGPMGENPKHDESMFPDAWRYDHVDQSSRRLQNAWGMAVDLNSCIGCSACVVSCYAENNLAVVGREQVKIGRDMQWIRIDTYFEGDLHAPRAHFQPMMCQHCENAGCEQVCPVNATVHSPEGLNLMVYNRCVGTRYCSNNCIYKVRRFNFLLYSDYETESLKFMRNPDVTVRSRGVMEKCTYCVQRIEEAKITADKENRAIRDGEVVTACQQACPTDAILFGNINDPASKVSARKRQERDYPVLADLNYRPRTTYTAGVINPNPALELI